MPHKYFAFGLSIESEWVIPSLAAAEYDFSRDADVEIARGEVPAPATLHDVDGTKIGIAGGKVYLEIEECGRFQIVEGRRIIVQPEPGATDEQVNLFLLGSVFGVLLHQRGIVPFHCNAVEVDGTAFLFCGDSGAGKSTLAAHFADRGFRLLCDDVCALELTVNGELTAVRGVPRLKLWQDTLKHFGRSSAELKLVPWYEDKFEMPLTGESPVEPVPVAGLYHLRIAEDGRDAGIYPLSGLEAANAVTANIYRRRLADIAGAAPRYLAVTAGIVGSLPIFTVNRRWGFEYFEQEANEIETHMRQIAEKRRDSTTGRRDYRDLGRAAHS